MNASSLRADLLRAALFAASLFVLRLDVMRELGLDLGRALALGSARGFAYDALLALVPLAASRALYAAIGLAPALGWLLTALPLWLASAANVVYFRYFGERLDFWVVQHHLGDVISVRGALGPLLTPALAVSLLVALGLGVVLLLRAGRAPRVRPSRTARRTAAWSALLASQLFGISVLGLSTWYPRLGTVLNDQIVLVWLKTAFGTRRITYPDEVRPEIGTMVADLRAWDDAALDTLARYRDVGGRVGDRSVRDAGDPMRAHFAAPEADVRAARAALGLDEVRRPHVVLLFLESVRDFEIQHEVLGPIVFPELRALLAEHAIHFRQAYSSAAGAGLTARGQFTTMCSLLDNMRGAATYITHYRLRAHCLQGLARENGYRTFWISSQDSTYQGKRIFETLHGTERFYDEAYWKPLGLPHNFDNCGVADEPFLAAYLELLEQLDAEDPRPFLVNTLTMSTHPPHTVVPGVELPTSLMEAVSDEGYRGYLSRLRYLDRALGGFFRALFASPLAGHTLVVLLGDHSMKVEPHLPLAPHQRIELLARVPLALITRDLPSPRTVDHPVHQVDVAPTVATLAGLEGDTSWVGRSLLGVSGTPWVMRIAGAGLSYRVGERACYETVQDSARRCFALAGRDPLFASELTPVAERPEESEFLSDVVEASSRAIMLDRLLRTGTRSAALGR